MFQKLFAWLSGGTAEKIGEYFIERQQLKNQLALKKLEGRIAIEEAKTMAVVRKQEMTHTWEMAQIANSGYKDEVVLGVLLLPYIGAFVPGVQEHILIGFQHLDQMPYWAVGLTVTIFLAIYGIRHRNAARLRAPGLRDEDVDGHGKSPAPSRE